MSERILGREKGVYELNVKKGEDGTWAKDISRDLYRTYPYHPYFST